VRWGFLSRVALSADTSAAFNATDVVEAALETCKRGVEVTLWLDLGASARYWLVNVPLIAHRL
jgi:hypothetical protein